MTGTELDLYTNEEPSHNLAFNLFGGTWSSNIPGFGLGTGTLFEDGRIQWLEQVCDGIAGKSVLELGPLEGGHTFMLANAGASSILAIESNAKAFLKCLLVQNALKFSAEFMYGDFRKVLQRREQHFDMILASGVLYHMTDPVALLEDMAHASNSICLWTHYYDSDVAATNASMQKHISATPSTSEFRTRSIHMHRQDYLDNLENKKFIGGSSSHSNWLTRESLLGILDDLGMTVIIGRDDSDHAAGPSILLYATRISDFDESGYLERHPDVARAVDNGQFKSGQEHYIRFGKNEGRSL
ncbi:class I SAM-dependent methyltransferase [Paraburkholderia aspalathi]|uniref:class I SAM-dependent methyltransferase n=1 Tax=Paraburkholderia aspalathi TaxID=1324617 RepID=UPI0038BCEAC7